MGNVYKILYIMVNINLCNSILICDTTKSVSLLSPTILHPSNSGYKNLAYCDNSLANIDNQKPYRLQHGPQ